MAESQYLKPKVKAGSFSDRKAQNGMFRNVSSYMQYAGFSSANKLPTQEPKLNIEKSPGSVKGKPI